MHSNLSHAYHEQYSKKKDSIKEKNRENREKEKKRVRQIHTFWVVEWQTTDVVQSPRSDKGQQVAREERAGSEKKESKKRKNWGKRENRRKRERGGIWKWNIETMKDIYYYKMYILLSTRLHTTMYIVHYKL